MDQISSTSGSRTKIVEAYMKAKEIIIEKGFASEIGWQDKIRISQITERDLLREAHGLCCRQVCVKP